MTGVPSGWTGKLTPDPSGVTTGQLDIADYQRKGLTVVANPNPGDDIRGIPDKPSIGVLIGGAGFAGSRPTYLGAASGSILDDPFEHIGNNISD